MSKIDSLKSDRPCLVNGVKAIFHGWFVDCVYTNSTNMYVLDGLVEMKDGSLHHAKAIDIKFMD